MKHDADNKRYLIAYLFFLSITTVRFFTEAHFANFGDPQNLIFHHHYWFLFVFFLFLLNFKYILKMPPKRTWWMAFFSPVILIPMLYFMVFGNTSRIKLNYISIKELDIYFRDIFTFMIFSERNQAIAGELIVIVIGISAFSYFISRKVVRSLIMGMSCYLSLMILAGTVLIAPHKPERVLFFVSSGMRVQNFFSFLFFFAALFTAGILFSEEIKLFFKGNRSRQLVFSFLFVSFFTGFQFFLKRPEIADRILMIPHSFLYSLFITVVIFVKKEWMLKILLLVHVIVSSGILYNHRFVEMARRVRP